MNDTEPPKAPTSPSQGNARGILVLSLLAALFGSGLLLAWGLDAEQLVAEGTAQVRANAKQTHGAPAAGSEPTNGLDANALLTLEQRLSDAHDRIDDLTAEAEAEAEASDVLAVRVHRFEERLAQGGIGDALVTRLTDLEERLVRAEAAIRQAEAQARAVADAREEQAQLNAAYAGLGAQFSATGMLVRLDETALRFEPGRSSLPVDARQALAPLARFLLDHPEQVALLRGHTDSTGASDANLALAAARAESVREMLMALGVPADRLPMEGVGDAEPIADNGSVTGRQRNRRVDILLRGAAEA